MGVSVSDWLYLNMKLLLRLSPSSIVLKEKDSRSFFSLATLRLRLSVSMSVIIFSLSTSSLSRLFSAHLTNVVNHSILLVRELGVDTKVHQLLG